jgi:glycosidase
MYWIALTDCDGFRIDTVKHVSYEQARNFCGAVKEFATNLGKRDFFLVPRSQTMTSPAAISMRWPELECGAGHQRRPARVA